MVSSCKFNYKVHGRKAEKEPEGIKVLCHTLSVEFLSNKLSFISLGETNPDMPFEPRKTQGCTLGERIQFEGQAKLGE